MGITGSGKTALGRAWATRHNWLFLDADEFHSPSAIEKMRSGQPLTDADRLPWLKRLRQLLDERSRPLVLACSALRQTYRTELGLPHPSLRLVYLRANQDLLIKRLQQRSGHFADARLVPSQIAVLEEPQDALWLDAHAELTQLIEQLTAWWENLQIGATPPPPHSSTSRS